MPINKHILSIAKSCFHQLRDFEYAVFVLSFLKLLLSFLLRLLFIFVKSFEIVSFMVFLYILFIAHKKQNTVARIVNNSSRFSHITPTLKSLYWLPTFYRINFKKCCITHRALSLSEPFYLSTLLILIDQIHVLSVLHHSSLFYYLFFLKNEDFRTFFMLYHFSRIIYLIPFAMQFTYMSFRRYLKTY